MGRKEPRLPGYVQLDVPGIIALQADQEIGDCPNCGSTNVVGHGAIHLTVRDIPKGGPVEYHIDRRRSRCRACSKTFAEPLPNIAIDRVMTNRLVQWIIDESIRRSFVDVAADVGVSEGTVRSIFKRHLDAMEPADREQLLNSRKGGPKAKRPQSSSSGDSNLG